LSGRTIAGRAGRQQRFAGLELLGLHATGLPLRVYNGLTTNNHRKNAPIFSFVWWDGGSCRTGAFLQPETYPLAKSTKKEKILDWTSYE